MSLSLYWFYQDSNDNVVQMIRLNLVIDNDDSVKRGLFANDTDVLSNLRCVTFEEILTTDATTDDGQNEVARYFWG